LTDLDKFTFTPLTGSPYYVYGHSYLGYGMDAAQAKLQKSMSSAEETDPCYPNGYFRKNEEKLVTGIGDATACQRIIAEKLFSGSETEAPGKYAGEKSVHGAFAATENFFYVRNDLKIALDGNIDAMEAAASKGCSDLPKSYLPQEADMKEGKANPSDPKHCFGLSFQAALIRALRIPGRAGVKVDIARKINGGDLDWALGAAVKHFIDSGMAGAALGASPSPLSSMMMGILFLASAGVIFVAFRSLYPKKNCPKSVEMHMSATTIGGKGAE
jgi:hypothetical protein